jgi:tRNA modification GTPase
LTSTIVLSALLMAGARQALPGEFTRRAVMNGRMDLVQAEAVADLIDARTRMAHQAALGQLDGSLSRRIHALRDAILELESLIAYDVDFPEEDEGRVDPERVRRSTDDVQAALDHLLGTAETGEMLREGALVVIGGAPNAGKSTLFNALVGRQRAIVTEIAGTTRDAIETLIDLDGWPVRLVDTAGLRETTDVVERLGIEVSERYLADADIVLLCAEEPRHLGELERRVKALTDASVISIQTKADLPGQPVSGGVKVSAHTGEGMGMLASDISRLLREHYGTVREEAPMLTRARHREAVASACRELAQFREEWMRGEVPVVIAAVHVRTAAHHLTELIGSVDVEDVLTRVFSTFCIGK